MPVRLVLACLLLIACGDDDDGGAAGSGGGTGGRSGTSGSAGQSGTSSQTGAGTGHAGAAGRPPHAGDGAAHGGNGGGGGGSGQSAYGMIKLRPNIVAGSQIPLANNEIGQSASALRIGTVSATTLLSLKYYIYSIQLCEDVTLMGSGFSGTSGCIQLYQNQPAGSPDYSTYTVAAAQADTAEGHYVDLMTPEGRALLNQPVTLRVPIAQPDSTSPSDDVDGGVVDPPSRAGVYKYGLINFYRPIKVTAEFPIIGEPGKAFRTRAVSSVQAMPGLNGGIGTERVLIGDTRSDAAPEETTYMLNNGGALFVFQTPFAITQADVDAGAEIKIDLVFNPDHFGQAYTTHDCANQPFSAVCDPVNNVVIDMPYVRMSPVPRKSGEKTHKETYLLDYEEHSKLRIELYYNDADSTAGIQGVDTAIVYDDPGAELAGTPSNNIIASNFVSQSGSVTTSDAHVSLLDYQHTPTLDGLVRRQSGNVTIHCVFTGSACPTVGGEVVRAYTYVGDSIVSTN